MGSRQITLVLTLFVMVYTAKVNAEESACTLLSSCLNTTAKLYAECDKHLDNEPPACWAETRPAVHNLRLAVGEHYDRLGKCLEGAASDDKGDDLMLMSKEKSDRCSSMLRHYLSAARTWDLSAAKRRRKRQSSPPSGTHSKPHLAFYNCVAGAQRRAHMCNSLAQCCNRQKRCEWDEQLGEKFAAETKLKLAVLDRTQTCLKQMQLGGGDKGSAEMIDFLKPQNFWQE